MQVSDLVNPFTTTHLAQLTRNLTTNHKLSNFPVDSQIVLEQHGQDGSGK